MWVQLGPHQGRAGTPRVCPGPPNQCGTPPMLTPPVQGWDPCGAWVRGSPMPSRCPSPTFCPKPSRTPNVGGARAAAGAGGALGIPSPPSVSHSQEPELQQVLWLWERFWGSPDPQMCPFPGTRAAAGSRAGTAGPRGLLGTPEPPKCPIPRSRSCSGCCGCGRGFWGGLDFQISQMCPLPRTRTAVGAAGAGGVLGTP